MADKAKAVECGAVTVRPAKVSVSKVLVLGLTVRGNAGIITNNAATGPRFRIPASGPVVTAIADTMRNAIGLPGHTTLVLGLTVKVDGGKVTGARVTNNASDGTPRADFTVTGDALAAMLAEPSALILK